MISIDLSLVGNGHAASYSWDVLVTERWQMNSSCSCSRNRSLRLFDTCLPKLLSSQPLLHRFVPGSLWLWRVARACLGATELQAHVAICWPLWGGGNILKPLQPPLCEPTFHGPFSPRDADLGHSCSTGCFVFISSIGITSAKERWKGVWWPVEQMLCGPLCTKSPSLSSFSLNRITKIIPLSELKMLCQMGPWQYFSSWYPKLILAIRVGPLWGGPSSCRLKSLSDWEEQRQKRVKKQGQSLQCDISRFDSTLVKK